MVGTLQRLQIAVGELTLSCGGFSHECPSGNTMATDRSCLLLPGVNASIQQKRQKTTQRWPVAKATKFLFMTVNGAGTDLKSLGRKAVRVRVPPSAPLR